MSARVHTCTCTIEAKSATNVLEIGELRERIFTHMKKTTLTKCARVCILWSEDALNLLWKELDSVRPLLSVVCPLTEDVCDFHIEGGVCFSDHSDTYRYLRGLNLRNKLAQFSGSVCGFMVPGFDL